METFELLEKYKSFLEKCDYLNDGL